MANISGGVPGSDPGNDASEDDGDRAGVDEVDEWGEKFSDDGWKSSL